MYEELSGARVAAESTGIYNQLLDYLGTEIIKSEQIESLDSDDAEYSERIRRSLLAGFFSKAAYRVQGDDNYKSVKDNYPFLIEPDSCLVGMGHEWVICHNFHFSSIQYMQVVTAAEAEWLLEYPIFKDDRLPRRVTGELKNPEVKQSLDKARAKPPAPSKEIPVRVSYIASVIIAPHGKLT
ncbi:pre-mRNA-splicing factor ATP-dependent RNA helicase prp43 [Fusarium austroafricanum]|uniref:Pre-mRNA-splicing factor ATP-dependent RNA helicase prp43 n=1 Tax=Fusarium austroafricanum TaxID=2364996 RepID=A0A8H4KIG0_9HYPO|nr:pre-mRNA-splicing factor ATP-dependent RNA helicase prp43 [Fusarium austroafricanum]